MAQLLIAVKIEGYFLELLINRDSTIKDLVRAMRQNQFIKSDKDDNMLEFFNDKDQELGLTDSITRLICNEENKPHKI